MMQVSENISSLKRILTIKEEIELAYLNPAYSTETSKLIRKMEADIQLHTEIYRKVEEYIMINMIEIEQERKIEDEEQYSKYNHDYKVWVENILHQLELDTKKHREEILMQLSDKKNIISEKLNDIPVILAKIDLYLDLLQKQELILEKRNLELITALNAIKFDEPFVVMINGKPHNIILNELTLLMMDNTDPSVKCHDLVEPFIKRLLSKIFDSSSKAPQGEIDEVVNQVKTDAKLLEFMNFKDEHNKNLEILKTNKNNNSTYNNNKNYCHECKDIFINMGKQIPSNINEIKW